MKLEIVLMVLIMAIGSYANASTVAVGNGSSWTASMNGVEKDTAKMTLNAHTSTAYLNWGNVGYPSGIEPKRIGGTPGQKSSVTSVSLSDWTFSNVKSYGFSTKCEEANSGSYDQHGCAFAENLAGRISLAAGDLAIVLGAELGSAVLVDKFHLKVRWEDEKGKKTARHIPEDLTAVPLPAAAWLFTSTLMGLLLVARQKNREATLSE